MATQVRSFPESTGPVLGTVSPGESYLKIDTKADWLWIVFQGMTGWIHGPSALAGTAPADDGHASGTETGPTRRPPGQATPEQAPSPPLLDTPRLAIAGAILGILAVVLTFFVVESRTKKAKRKSRDRRAGRRVLIVGPESKTIWCTYAKSSKPLSQCFEEVGFRAYSIKNLAKLASQIESLSPHVLAVDRSMDNHCVAKVERVLRRKSAWTNMLVVFYNVPGMDGSHGTQAVGLLKNAWNFGTAVSDKHLFEVITPIVTGNGEPPGPSQGAGGTTTLRLAMTALQGRIIDDSLQEVYLFMEIGKKTGRLLVETTRPYGTVYFDEGRIVYASTDNHLGIEAALDMLKITRGIFRFAPDKKPDSRNCDITASAILLEGAKRRDEENMPEGAVGFYVPSGSEEAASLPDEQE